MVGRLSSYHSSQAPPKCKSDSKLTPEYKTKYEQRCHLFFSKILTNSSEIPKVLSKEMLFKDIELKVDPILTNESYFIYFQYLKNRLKAHFNGDGYNNLITLINQFKLSLICSKCITVNSM